MASVKVTITLPEGQVHAVKELVSRGQAPSVSGFVKHAVAVTLDDVAGWQRTLDDALDASGGPMTADERQWADRVLTGSEQPVA